MHAFLAVFLSLTTFLLPARDFGQARFHAALISHTVRVTSYAGVDDNGDSLYNLCTGFVVAPGHVLTAMHCAGPRLQVDGRVALVEAQDPDQDLMLMAALTGRKPPVVLTRETPGGTLIGVGWGEGLLQVRQAMVVALHFPSRTDRSVGLLGHPGWLHGMSGGPIYNVRGEAVGMVVSICCQGEYGYGPEAGVLVDFLEAAGVTLPR